MLYPYPYLIVDHFHAIMYSKQNEIFVEQLVLVMDQDDYVLWLLLMNLLFELEHELEIEN